VTPFSVDLLLALYKKGGKLRAESLHRVLRQSYQRLKRCGNISQLSMSCEDRVTVVGDLHGQLADLLFVLEDSGLPGPTRKYIFNGDFVDRGAEGVEVTTLLLALYCAFPGWCGRVDLCV
jgi:hypothetical protein